MPAARFATTVTPERRTATGWLVRGRRWDPVRVGLLLLVLLTSVAGVVLGARSSSYAELRGQVLAGEVSSVEVDGTGLPPGATGFTTIQVEWRDGIFRHTAEVASARPLSEAPTGTVAIRGDVARDLQALDPGVTVVQVGEAPSSATLAGWEVPLWLSWVYLAQLFLGLGLLSGGAEPWRATRWGWAWPMLAVPPFGLVAFLLLAAPGPTSTPKAGARRLTGGWSFLLTVIVLVPLVT